MRRSGRGMPFALTRVTVAEEQTDDPTCPRRRSPPNAMVKTFKTTTNSFFTAANWARDTKAEPEELRGQATNCPHEYLVPTVDRLLPVNSGAARRDNTKPTCVLMCRNEKTCDCKNVSWNLGPTGHPSPSEFWESNPQL